MVSAKGANEMCKNARSLRGPNIYVEMTSASRHSKTWQPALLSLKGVLNTMKPAELTKNARLFDTRYLAKEICRYACLWLAPPNATVSPLVAWWRVSESS